MSFTGSLVLNCSGVNFSIGSSTSSFVVVSPTARCFLYSESMSESFPHLKLSANTHHMINPLKSFGIGRFSGAGSTLYCIHEIIGERL
jgi:hypothetical protein